MECVVCKLELRDLDHWKRHMASLTHRENLRIFASQSKSVSKEETATEGRDDDGFKIPAPKAPAVNKVSEPAKEEHEDDNAVAEAEEAHTEASNSQLPLPKARSCSNTR